jgi:hypothetical protein
MLGGGVDLLFVIYVCCFFVILDLADTLVHDGMLAFAFRYPSAHPRTRYTHASLLVDTFQKHYCRLLELLSIYCAVYIDGVVLWCRFVSVV